MPAADSPKKAELVLLFAISVVVGTAMFKAWSMCSNCLFVSAEVADVVQINCCVRFACCNVANRRNRLFFEDGRAALESLKYFK